MTQELPNRARSVFSSEDGSKPPPEFEKVAESVGVPLTEFRLTPHGKVAGRKAVNESTSNDQMTSIALRLPEKPVQVGDSWQDDQQVNVVTKDGKQLSVRARQKFVLASVKNGVATIRVEDQILDPAARNDPSMEAQLVLAQRLTQGTIKFDIDAGRILSQQMDIDRRIVGFSGPRSRMHYLMRFTEKLSANKPKVARRKGEAPSR